MENNNQNPNNGMTAKIIWIALIFSCLVHGFILQTMGKLNLSFPSLSPMVIGLFMMGLSTPVVGLFLSQKLQQKAQDYQSQFTGYIVGWVLAESAVLFGFVITFQTGAGLAYVSLFLYALFFFFLLRPRI